MNYTSPVALLSMLLCIMCTTTIYAQKNKDEAPVGSLRGKVIDIETGEGLIGATVQLLGTNLGTATDLDGNYVIKDIPTGVYDLECSYLGYVTQRVIWMKINEDRASLSYFKLKPGDAKELGVDVVVTAFAARNMEAALLAKRKKAANLLDYISSEEFLRNGDSKLIDGLKRISGVTVENNQTFYLRGLEQRYNNTLLNGYEIPGIESTIASEILYSISSAMVDNVSIQKNASADIPANATSGSINVATKSFQDKLDLQVSIGTSFNTLATFNTNFLRNDAVKSFGLFEVEILEGTQFIPTSTDLPQTQDAVTTNNLVMETILRERYEMPNQMPLPTGNLSFYIGNQHTFSEQVKMDYQFLIFYNQKFQHYNAGRTGVFRNNDTDTLRTVLDLEDKKSNKNINMGALASLGLKIGKHSRVKASILWNDASYGFARQQSGYNSKLADGLVYNSYTWDFNSRGMVGLFVDGDHHFGKGKFATRFNWHFTYNNSGTYQPDLRYFSYASNANQTDFNFDYTNAYQPVRYVRDQVNSGLIGGGNLLVPIPYKNENKKYFKVGVFYNSQNRTSIENRFYYQNQSGLFDGNIAGFIQPENYMTSTSDTMGIYVYNNRRLRNNYAAFEDILASYVLFDGIFSQKFRFNVGVRAEWTNNKININDGLGISYGTGDIRDVPNLDSTWNVGQNYILPFVSASMHYRIKENMYLRVAASNTITRPSLRELSAFRDFDYIGGYVFEGNSDLEYAQGVNLDVRWEFFPATKEIIAVSLFSKVIDKPIEKVATIDDNNLVVNFRNTTFAAIAGIELECKKRLDFIGDWAKDLRLLFNFSYIYSTTRVNGERLVRPLFGQAPYVLNTGFSYDNKETGTQATILFNITGRKTMLVMTDGSPNIEELPRPTLDVNIVQFLGKKKQWKIQVSAQNLLGARHQQVQEYKGKTYYYEFYPTGQEFYLGLAYLIQ